MRVALLNRPGEVVVAEREEPTPGRDEVLVRVRSVGVCGSDTHYYDHGRIGSHVVREPLVLGHEASGVVEATGEDVTTVEVGQRVSIEPGVPCRGCEQCLAGRYNLCPDVVFHATPPVDGSLAELVVIHQAFVYAVPDSVSDEAAALLEPLSVGIWACRKGEVGVGSRVLITGAGPIGLVALQVALAAGAGEVVVCDVNPDRLALAAELGATRALDTSSTDLEQVYAGGPAPQALLECSGHPGATLAGLGCLAPAGRAVLVGMGGDELPVPVSLIQERELMLTGTFRYANTWPTAISLAASGRVDLDRMVTGRFALAETEAALTAARRDPAAVKSVIQPWR